MSKSLHPEKNSKNYGDFRFLNDFWIFYTCLQKVMKKGLFKQTDQPD